MPRNEELSRVLLSYISMILLYVLIRVRTKNPARATPSCSSLHSDYTAAAHTSHDAAIWI